VRSRRGGWNRLHIPSPIVVVLAGVGLGSVYDGSGLEREPHLILAIVLPAIGLVATTLARDGSCFVWIVIVGFASLW
jgi:hypothetical protein